MVAQSRLKNEISADTVMTVPVMTHSISPAIQSVCGMASGVRNGEIDRD